MPLSRHGMVGNPLEYSFKISYKLFQCVCPSGRHHHQTRRVLRDLTTRANTCDFGFRFARLLKMGAFALLSSWIDAATTPRHKKKRKQFQTVELRVRMDCEGCERKVKNAVASMKGVSTVEVERKQHKVTVTGYVDANKVLKRVRQTGKKAEMWPYKPYHLVYYPYTAQVYDKKAPSGYVRNVDPTFPSYPHDNNNAHETYTALFSDDNTNACAIM